jgi:hypothetical protein
METQNLKVENDIITLFVLSDEEMISIRGGESDSALLRPSSPPIQL